MNLVLLRSFPQETETIGDLFIEDKWFCHTLEDRVRPVGAPKVYGETAIPYGIYPVELTWSPRFQMVTPLVMDVPNFEAIRIHPGNTHKDTEGCILVGDAIGRDHDSLLQSRAAFARLMPLLLAAVGEGLVLEIRK